MTVWTEIADTLVKQIDSGALTPGDRLPSDSDLAAQFDVNRHTVRRAIAHLAAQGLVRSERGRGSFVVDSALSYRLGARTKFEENLLDNSRTPSRRLISMVEMIPPEDVAKALQLGVKENVLMATMLGEADGVPVHVFKAHIPLKRFPEARQALESLFSNDGQINASLGGMLDKLGVSDFKRSSARIRARPPTSSEARQLEMPKTGSILELEVLNIDDGGCPVFFGSTAMCGSRIEFILDL